MSQILIYTGMISNSEYHHDDTSPVEAFIVIRPPCEFTVNEHCHGVSNSFNMFCHQPYFLFSSIGVTI